MEKKMILSGKIKPGISKPENVKEIINKINKLKIKKIQKEILFLTALTILTPQKETIDLIYKLERYKREGKIYPDFSRSKYITNIINEIKSLESKQFEESIDELIKYVQNNDIEL